MTNDTPSRVLALELRHRRIGFAVLEGPGRLLDTGVKRYQYSGHVLAILRPIVTIFEPSALALRQANHRTLEHRKSASATVHLVRTECNRQSVGFNRISTHDVRHAFGDSGTSKEEIAAEVARIFPELQWQLPPTRHKRSWISEGWNMPLFDAVATGLTYFANLDELHGTEIRNS
jgi:hypothetical protein